MVQNSNLAPLLAQYPRKLLTFVLPNQGYLTTFIVATVKAINQIWPK